MKKNRSGDVVENAVDKNGIRTVRIVGNAEIDEGAWRSIIPWYAKDLPELKVKRWYEKAFGVYYLEMKWPAREPYWTPTSEAPEPPGDEPYNSLLWYCGNVKRVRDALPEAVEAFLGYVGDLPTRLYLRSTKNVPKTVVAWEDGFIACEVSVTEMSRLPEKFIVLR